MQNTQEKLVGRESLLAGVLMTVGVAGELVLNPQQRDGQVVDTVTFALCVLTGTVGFGLLATTLFGVAQLWSRTRLQVRGARVAMVGAALLFVSGSWVLITGVVSGQPDEFAFVFFGLGMLLLVVGQVMLGLGLRRAKPNSRLWMIPNGAAVAIFLAFGVPLDPWHDLGMFAFFGLWALFGVVLLADRVPEQAASLEIK